MNQRLEPDSRQGFLYETESNDSKEKRRGDEFSGFYLSYSTLVVVFVYFLSSASLVCSSLCEDQSNGAKEKVDRDKRKTGMK